MGTIQLGPHTVETSSEDKVLFPDAGLTKGDLIDYYRRVADRMLPYLEGRPATMKRYPDGIDADGFYQQKASDYFPDFVERVEVPKEDGGTVTHAVIGNAAALVYLANQNTITPHVWLSRVDALRQPDRVLFDLDPPEGDDFGPVRDAARHLRARLEDVGLTAFVMTTGSKGVHVVAPIRRGPDFDDTRAFARELADALARDVPDAFTTEQRKDKRRGRVFLDTLRNAYGQTAVPPYAVRARPGAPVATPVDWDELSDVTPRRYTIENLFRRLGQKDDPWQGFARHAASLDRARDALAS